MAATEPEAKKAKTDEDSQKPEAPKAQEPPKENESDAPADKQPRIKDKVWFNVSDTTVNLMSSSPGNFLKSLSDGGIQHFVAGARANVGIKSGRYMFEVKIVEQAALASYDQWQENERKQHLLKVGFSTSSSSLIAGEDAESMCFDSEGNFVHDKHKKALPSRPTLGRDHVAAVLLNLDDKSENFNTISLFRDGVRISPPQALPERLKGKTLFPSVAFKNMTVHVNFGASTLTPLPFKCRTIQDASSKDVAVTKEAPAKDGKYEVVVPVGLPDEGTFVWLDMFHKKNPGYTEISDRMILDWAEQSGIWRRGGYKNLECTDMPELNFDKQQLDDRSMTRMIKNIAPLQKRNYVIMEVRNNLMKDSRKKVISKFPSSSFRKVAQVQMGEPSVEFKKRTQELSLQRKQYNSDVKFEQEKQEARRKRDMEKKQKLAEILKKKADKEARKKKLEAAKKAAEEAAAKVGEEKKEDSKADEKKAEAPQVVLDESDDEVEMVPEKEEEEKNEPPPTVELTTEEKQLWFMKPFRPDLTPPQLSSSFGQFSAPDKDEGFDDVRYDFQKKAKCEEYLKNWVLERKLSTRVEHIKPGTWFQNKMKAFSTMFTLWQTKQKDWSNHVVRKEGERKKAVAKSTARAAAEAAAKLKAEAAGEEYKAPEAEEKAEEPEPEVNVNLADVDVFAVEDVLNVGGVGMPLCRDFSADDWTMLRLRFELYVLGHAFRKDVDDPERAGIHMDHLAFYYKKYFKAELFSLKFGVPNMKEVCSLVDDTVFVSKQGVLEPILGDEMETFNVFLKLTEEARRHRQLQVDCGNEDVKLKINQHAMSDGHHGGKRDFQNQQFNWQAGTGMNQMAAMNQMNPMAAMHMQMQKMMTGMMGAQMGGCGMMGGGVGGGKGAGWNKW